MSKRTRVSIVTLSATILVIFIGCSMVQDAVIPTYIAPEAADYAEVNVPAGPLPFTTLWDAKRVDKRLDFAHELNQIQLARLQEDDLMTYNYLRNNHTLHLQQGQQLKQTIFSPTGPIGLLISGFGFGTIGALTIPRPQDIKKRSKK